MWDELSSKSSTVRHISWNQPLRERNWHDRSRLAAERTEKETVRGGEDPACASRLANTLPPRQLRDVPRHHKPAGIRRTPRAVQEQLQSIAHERQLERLFVIGRLFEQARCDRRDKIARLIRRAQRLVLHALLVVSLPPSGSLPRSPPLWSSVRSISAWIAASRTVRQVARQLRKMCTGAGPPVRWPRNSTVVSWAVV